jgi:hypothetical protein
MVEIVRVIQPLASSFLSAGDKRGCDAGRSQWVPRLVLVGLPQDGPWPTFQVYCGPAQSVKPKHSRGPFCDHTFFSPDDAKKTLCEV